MSLKGDDDLPDMIFPPSPLRATVSPKGLTYIPGSVFSVKPKIEELGAGVGKTFTVGISQSEDMTVRRDQGVQSPAPVLRMDHHAPTIVDAEPPSDMPLKGKATLSVSDANHMATTLLNEDTISFKNSPQDQVATMIYQPDNDDDDHEHDDDDDDEHGDTGEEIRTVPNLSIERTATRDIDTGEDETDRDIDFEKNTVTEEKLNEPGSSAEERESVAETPPGHQATKIEKKRKPRKADKSQLDPELKSKEKYEKTVKAPPESSGGAKPTRPLMVPTNIVKKQVKVDEVPSRPDVEEHKSDREAPVFNKFRTEKPTNFAKNLEEFRSKNAADIMNVVPSSSGRNKLKWDALKMPETTRGLDSVVSGMKLDEPLLGEDIGRARLELSIIQDRLQILRDTVSSPESELHSTYATAQRTIDRISQSLGLERMSSDLIREEIQRLHAIVDGLRRADDLEMVRARLAETERLLDFADHWHKRKLLMSCRPTADPGEPLRQLISEIQASTGKKPVFQPHVHTVVSYCVAEIPGECICPSNCTQAGRDPWLSPKNTQTEKDWKMRLRNAQDEQWKRMMASREPY
jgi:hypothetical protein